jgi:ACDE family multidrug resistance protein
MFYRRPVGLNTLESDAGGSIARMASIEGFARALLIGIVPLVALEALGSKAAVAQIYLIGALFTLSITLNFSTLERILHRRRVVLLAGFLLIGACFALYSGSGLIFALGIGMRAAAASLFSVCLSLYIMDYIGKRELAHSESRRMLFNGLAWLIGPSLGLWLWHSPFKSAAYILSALSALAMMRYFWILRFGANKIVKKAKSPPINPFKIIPRYFQQSKLRIAYFITITRAIFWITVFVYGPIYVIEAGLPQWAAGLFLSLVSALLFFSLLIRKMAERYGTRTIIIGSLILCGVSIMVVGVIGEAKPYGIVFWVLAAIGAAGLDVLGNIPFMRMVKPRERTEMTMVFSTWREMAELLNPLIISLVLLAFPFEVFYFVIGISLLVAAYFASHLPARI